ncbi:hypothetical protein EDD15DRAFT_2379114 [Pisolithus albus]|nr:hypothetical protein EDD15DRAFT_2379114 [Pisolithus albus]
MFQDRGLDTDLLESQKLVFVEGDTSQESLGLEEKTYAEVMIQPGFMRPLRGSFVLSDNDPATDPGSLSLSEDGSGPMLPAHPPSLPSSLPTYTPVSRSPLMSDWISPYQCTNLNSQLAPLCIPPALWISEPSGLSPSIDPLVLMTNATVFSMAIWHVKAFRSQCGC